MILDKQILLVNSNLQARTSIKQILYDVGYKHISEAEQGFGGWFEIERKFDGERTRLGQDGNYVWGAKTLIKVTPPIPTLKREYVIFDRLGRSWENLDTEPSLSQISVIPWRETPVTPAWARYQSEPESEL